MTWLTSAMIKRSFAHLAASCQYLPAVAAMLSGLGYSQIQIDDALDLSGVQWCMDALAAQNVFIRFDVSVVRGEQPSCLLSAGMVPWGQARKLHTVCLDALQLQSRASLREQFSDSERDLARLHSCTGEVSSKWLTEFPSSWWPSIPDDKFRMALKFRFGISVFPGGCTCMHALCKDQTVFCGKDLDCYGDHAVMCNTGPYIFARRSRVNNTLAQAGRDAGYAALLEQVVPELGIRKRSRRGGLVVLEEAFLMSSYLATRMLRTAC